MDIEGIGCGEMEVGSCLYCESVRRVLCFVIIKCLASLQLGDYFSLFNINESKKKDSLRVKKILMFVLFHLLIKPISYIVFEKKAHLSY